MQYLLCLKPDCLRSVIQIQWAEIKAYVVYWGYQPNKQQACSISWLQLTSLAYIKHYAVSQNLEEAYEQ